MLYLQLGLPGCRRHRTHPEAGAGGGLSMFWGFSVDPMRQDLVHGFRLLRRTPVLTTVAVLSIALGIGANTAIFRVVDQMLLRELPVEKPGQLLAVQRVDSTGVSTRHSAQLFDFLAERSQSLSALTASGSLIWEPSKELADGETKMGAFVAGNYFSLLGLKPAAGRLLSPSDDKLATDGPVVVLDFDFWKQKFQQDPNAIGKLLRVNGEPLRIAGVAPEGFFGIEINLRPQIYIPIRLQPRIQKGKDYITKSKKWTMHWLSIVGRPKQGFQPKQAELELSKLLDDYNTERTGDHINPDREKATLVSAARGLSDLREKYSQPLQFLMAAVAMILLIACVNVANLLLERASARSKEIAVRIALGAGRWRIGRQLLTEGLLIGLPAGALGLLFSVWWSKGLSLWLNISLEDFTDMRMDWRILAFTFALSLLTTILFSLAPLFSAVRQDVHSSIKTTTSTTGKLAKGLVALETSLALVLLVGAGLFFSSLQNLRNVATGFRSEGALQFKINPGWNGPDDKKGVRYDKLEAELAALPGVRSVGFSTRGFLESNGSRLPGVRTTEFKPAKPEDATVEFAEITLGYFDAAGLKLLAGRNFDRNDGKHEEFAEVIINQAAVKRFWTRPNPIGENISFGPETENVRARIIGVVADAKYNELRQAAEPMLYFPYRKDFLPMYFGLIRADSIGAALSEPVRRIVQSEGVDLFQSATKLTEQVEQSTKREQLLASLSGLFGLVALALATMGIYGVISYTVTRRTAEMGLRMALGAMPGQVIWMMLKESMMLAALGIGVGIPAAYLLIGLLKSLLFGIDTSASALHIAAAALVLIVTTVAAGAIPAMRASRVSPLSTLRCD